jgi:ring-1,2-phenylacetyl-CoA epoxidase subunit PaaD
MTEISLGSALTRDGLLQALQAVKDPEIPVVSVVELGIVQGLDIEDEGRRVVVSITPTFSGCPALEMMRIEIADTLRGLGIPEVEVKVILDPPWSSDRITPAARARMREIGLAPPPPRSRYTADIALLASPSAGRETVETVVCPFCDSTQTELENAFGPTICRSLHYCLACQQPFEQFKAL